MNSNQPIEKYWADFFGIEIQNLFDGKTHIVPHRGLAGYHGSWVFRSNGSTIISVPESGVTSATSRAAKLSFASMTPDAILPNLFRDRISNFIGPAYEGFINQESFRTVIEPEARLATATDIDALKKLPSDCSQEDWEHSSIDFDDALPSNMLVLWQTLVANVSSIKVAERLGAKKFAESYAARLSLEE
jgi:hypothetical protein